jgi:hypothetical protein
MPLPDTKPTTINHHIFNYTYLYAIPAYHRYSKEYNQKVGHLSSDNRQIDANLMNEYVNIGGTIADIVRLYSNGAEIKFQKQTDLVEIYEVLTAHLNNWVGYVQNDPNVKNAPLESLALMAEFAESIKSIVIGYKPRVQDVPKLTFINSFFGANVQEAEKLMHATGVGSTVQNTGGLVDRLEKLLADRHGSK